LSDEKLIYVGLTLDSVDWDLVRVALTIRNQTEM
jgi:hypothetical protein